VGHTGTTGQRRRIGLKSASKRDIAEINAGLKTINDVLKERGKDTKPWGDQEFDRQCLLADEDPFTGAMKVEGVTTVTLGSSDITDLTWKDFRDAVYKVTAEERKDCSWFLNETVLNHIANIEDSEGRPIWRRPTEAMPGKLDLYPYHEVSIMPQLADIGANTPFAIFMKPKRIQHGDRKGIEIKKFDQTTESMQYGELFLRFRKRDGFLVTRPQRNMVILKTKAGSSGNSSNNG
jgi:hypothetical protein